MPEKLSEPQLPHGLSRLAFRLPIGLYRAGLGWLLGTRFVYLTHTGRKSGQPRYSVLEVVRYDPASGMCIVASGWGEKSDWYRNVTHDPHVTIQVKNRRSPALARRLPPEEAAEEMAGYARRHPRLMHELAGVMGYRLDGSEADARALGRLVPMFAFEPVNTGSTHGQR
jgi:deazaflavin-dependent oxidoreductase (nitroreductase family)